MEDLRFKSINLYSSDGFYFKSILCNEYEKILNYYNNDKRLNNYQKFVANYFQPKSNFNSLLMYHGTGLGKTSTSIAVINNILTFSNALNVIIICPAALKTAAWIPNLNNWLNDKSIINNIQFISIDSPSFNNDFDIVTKSISFNIPSLLIIDECHNFISSLLDETSNRKLVYFSLLELIQNYKIYLLCLSATPIVNKIEEIIYLFNLLRPNTFHKKSELFSELFVNVINGKVKNQDIFCKRITGLVSYFDVSSKDGMPKVTKNIIRLKMSDLQSESYLYYENSELSLKGGYKQKTIAACNFTLPIDIIKTSENKINLDEYIEGCTFDQLKDMSPKFHDIINKIKESKRVNLIHTSYIKTTLIPLEFYLEKYGYSKFTDIETNNYKSYYSIYGETSINEREKLLNIFNNIQNWDGKYIKILIFTDVFSAGVTLKYGENLFVLNYHWNSTKIEQVYGRIARLNTHIDLEEKYRFVNIYTYVMFRNKGETSDENLEKTTIQKDNINNMFLHLVKIASIDIDFNKSNKDYVYKDIEPFRVNYKQINTMKPFIYKSIMDDENIIRNQVTDIVISKKYTKLVNVSYINKQGNKKILSCLLIYPFYNYFLLDIKYYNYIGYIKLIDNKPVFDSENQNCFVAELII